MNKSSKALALIFLLLFSVQVCVAGPFITVIKNATNIEYNLLFGTASYILKPASELSVPALDISVHELQFHPVGITVEKDGETIPYTYEMIIAQAKKDPSLMGLLQAHAQEALIADQQAIINKKWPNYEQLQKTIESTKGDIRLYSDTIIAQENYISFAKKHPTGESIQTMREELQKTKDFVGHKRYALEVMQEELKKLEEIITSQREDMVKQARDSFFDSFSIAQKSKHLIISDPHIAQAMNLTLKVPAFGFKRMTAWLPDSHTIYVTKEPFLSNADHLTFMPFQADSNVAIEITNDSIQLMLLTDTLKQLLPNNNHTNRVYLET